MTKTTTKKTGEKSYKHSRTPCKKGAKIFDKSIYPARPGPVDLDLLAVSPMFFLIIAAEALDLVFVAFF